MEKQLHRIPRNKMIGGVCTGLAEYFAIDPVLIRLVFVILALHQGIGVIAYIILWIVVPVSPELALPAAPVQAAEDTPPADAQTGTAKKHEPGKGSFYGGVVLVVIGTLFLLDNFIPSFGFDDFWPVLLIAIGGSMLWHSMPRRHDQEEVLS